MFYKRLMYVVHNELCFDTKQEAIDYINGHKKDMFDSTYYLDESDIEVKWVKVRMKIGRR